MAKLERAREAGGNLTPEKAFGLILQRIRRERGLTQSQLSDQSGYHRNFIGLMERGEKSPSLRTFFDIAATLQVRPSDILVKVERLVGRAQIESGKR
jgi:transcriptional regulator with XRE-family HTH domain